MHGDDTLRRSCLEALAAWRLRGDVGYRRAGLLVSLYVFHCEPRQFSLASPSEQRQQRQPKCGMAPCALRILVLGEYGSGKQALKPSHLERCPLRLSLSNLHLREGVRPRRILGYQTVLVRPASDSLQGPQL